MSFLIILAALGLLLLLTLKKVIPFVALILVTMLLALALGMSVQQMLKALSDGIGSMLGSMALILCFGAIQGRLLEQCGAATVISEWLLQRLGKKYLPWAVCLMGFLVGIPLFYNAGFVILLPFVFTIAASANVPLLYVAIPMCSSLSVTHGFLPPHPGPVGLAAIFQASVGKIILYGLIAAIPTVFIAGILFGRTFRHRQPMAPPITNKIPTTDLPPVSTCVMIALLPVLLIALPVALLPFIPEGNFMAGFLHSVGDPVLALLLTVAVSSYFLYWRRGKSTLVVMDHYTKAIESVAMIMLVIGAGGALKEVLTKTGVANEIAGFVTRNAFPPLIAGWLVAAGIRVMLGSATVAGLTAAGILAPLVASGSVSPEWMVLSIGAGSLFLSHVNDTGFWMFKEYLGITVKDTLLSWTIMESIISVGGLLIILLFSKFL